ncbi:hypothetical protein BC830DRAFT_115150 [Chytriomyces sp. MP71]|nr:hypothetical protein BC830DRAFT_115150 [Chytriomyces sp. MP71]
MHLGCGIDHISHHENTRIKTGGRRTVRCLPYAPPLLKPGFPLGPIPSIRADVHWSQMLQIASSFPHGRPVPRLTPHSALPHTAHSDPPAPTPSAYLPQSLNTRAVAAHAPFPQQTGRPAPKKRVPSRLGPPRRPCVSCSEQRQCWEL